ncbi:MAG: peptidase M23 [endosymbiont of Galathealinum brachiosum]|uniref:Peptidase M23 n=1 Tax=endosymbiont of Galathealinum brachiosum TaxID=2200906 RepID=A0A370D696_9GAMM|nr:MAG: peptidase M23 [endosymbiont of Galathealinum brachiosum]
MKLLFKITLFFTLAISGTAFAFPQSNPVPGGIVLLPLDNNHIASTARFNKRKLAVVSDDKAKYLLIGLSLNTKPGKHYIEIRNNQGKTEKLGFDVKSKTYKAQYLTIKNKRKVNPYEKDMERILSEKKRKAKAKKIWTTDPTKADFTVPVDGRISSIFGLRRFFNEQARRPHSGLDIAAPQGTPIKAVESGTIIESGDFFFSGNMVYLDHGQGLISLYAHMHTITVKPGDKIEKGQIIGTVGETGRVTGPHLHLAIIANRTTVDPLQFLPQLSEKAAEYYKSE